MLALSHISRFEGAKESCKILKPIWDVITDYLVVFLVALSIAIAGMQISSGSFECLAAIDCPSITRSNMSRSFLSHIEYRNACKAFYSSRKTNIPRTVVVTDLKSSLQYAKFVNSECSKKAVPDFLSYFGFVLFTQALALLVFDNLWLKLPHTASIILSFIALVVECYASPCPNFALTHTLSNVHVPRKRSRNGYKNLDKHHQNTEIENVHDNHNHNDNDHSDKFSILEDSATISAVKTLYEKVRTLKKNVNLSHKIWQLYLIQAICQAGLAILFLGLDIHYMKDLEGTITCRLTQHIPVVHDYFICSHNLAPAFFWGLIIFYLPVLGVCLAVFIFTIGWTLLLKAKDTFKYDVEEKLSDFLEGKELSDVSPVYHDFGFLLHLLHSYNIFYVIRFAHFLSQKKQKENSSILFEDRVPSFKVTKRAD